MFLAKSKELVQYQVMEGSKNMQESDTASVVKVPREPAIIINGVPDLPPDFASGSQPAVRDAPGSRVDHRFGEWLEGRKVRKQFGDKYFAGKVVKYDSESNWYSVVYDDGDQEDLEWLELEEILLPLDITIPLRKLVMDKFKHQNAVPDYRLKGARSSQGTNGASNQMVVRAVNGQQSNNLPQPGLLQATPSNAETVRAEKLKMQISKRKTEEVYQPKKRGRPRKDRTISVSGDIQPKKRGRPPKEKNISGESSVHKRNAETVRAEKLKRESLRVQGA
uniref:PTM/DIR17-like Tudor domain-containing protein n=1 Tax=Aegilops tauschii subsp. strangulata TaxID=200361 RepID=A0A453FVD9_AEGTS